MLLTAAVVAAKSIVARAILGTSGPCGVRRPRLITGELGEGLVKLVRDALVLLLLLDQLVCTNRTEYREESGRNNQLLLIDVV